jgi:PKD repeat protein
MGETVSFEGEGIGGTPWLDENGEPRYGYSWQTGGAPSNSGEKAVDVVYNYPGVYTASFTIRDKAGNKDTEYIQVTVLGEELEAIINSPPNIQTKTGQTLSLEGEGIGGVPFLDESDEPYYLYFWQTGISTSINKTVEVIYDTKGEYDISFTVTDRAGKADTKYIHLRVEPGGE